MDKTSEYKLITVNPKQKSTLKKMFNEYMSELSLFDNTIKFDNLGNAIYEYFDKYFRDDDRFPYFHYKDNSVVGFSLIRKLEDKCFEIAEFYTLPEFRKDGNSYIFAKEILAKHLPCEFSTCTKNTKAVKFWNRVASLYTHYSRIDNDGRKNWRIELLSK